MMNEMLNEEKDKETITVSRTEYESLKAQNAELSQQVKWLMEQMRLVKHKQFGASSEKSEYDQISLFNEAEKEADDRAAEPELEEIIYKRKKRIGKKAEMLSDLPVETIDYYLSEEEQLCPECGEKMHVMGKDVRRELKIIPAQVKVVEHVRHVYSCRHCERYSDGTPIVKAAVSEPVIKGSLASPSTVAYIMTQKYVNAMPLNRQEQEFERLGVELSRQTMANWVIRCAVDWLEPLYNAMREILINRDVLHADESVLQVLKEPGPLC